MEIKNEDSSIIITITPEAIISRGKEQEVDITLKEARTILSRLAKDPDYISDTMDDFNRSLYDWIGNIIYWEVGAGLEDREYYETKEDYSKDRTLAYKGLKRDFKTGTYKKRR
tara:strand:- start:160 stop:498 length:339 start_codon:yes stop_codon:yes gene_type:complete